MPQQMLPPMMPPPQNIFTNMMASMPPSSADLPPFSSPLAAMSQQVNTFTPQAGGMGGFPDGIAAPNPPVGPQQPTANLLSQYVQSTQVTVVRGVAPPPPQPPQFDMTITDNEGGYETPPDVDDDEWAVVATNAVEVAATTPSAPAVPHHDARRDDNEHRCIICLDAFVTHRLTPCNHSHFCSTCVALIVAGSVCDPPECPLCRQQISGSEEIPAPMVVEQQPQRPQASREVEVYAFLLRQARGATPATATQRGQQSGFPSGVASSAASSGQQFTSVAITRQESLQITGTRDSVNSALAWMSVPRQRPPHFSGPWWELEEPESYYNLNRLVLGDGQVGLMPDTGAHDGLCGSEWAVALATRCKQASKPYSQKLMPQARMVRGVGNGAQSARYEVNLTAGIEDTDGNFYEESYVAPCIENSGVPGLMGIQSLERNNALIRCRTGEIYFLGEGGCDIRPSLGSRRFQMVKAKSGHWMLPVTRFRQSGAKTSGITLTTAAAATSSSAASSSS